MGCGPWKQFVPIGGRPLEKVLGILPCVWFDLRVKVLGSISSRGCVRYINVIQIKKTTKVLSNSHDLWLRDERFIY